MELRDAIAARKRHELQFAQQITVTNGKIVARNGSTAVAGVYDHLWVLPLGVGEPVAVYNRQVKSARINMGVAIGFEPYSTILEVLRTVQETTAGLYPTAGWDLMAHASSHYPEGDDPLFIKDRAILELLTYSTGQANLTVRVTDYLYRRDDGWILFPGLSSLSLAVHEPIGAPLARLVLVYLDTTTNTIKTVAGDTAEDTRSIIPPYPVAPEETAIESCFVRIAADQTTFVEPYDFFDARDFIGGRGSAGNQALKAQMLRQLAQLEHEFDAWLTKHIVEG